MMQVVTNDRYVRSKVKLGNVAHMVSLALLVAGLILSLLGETLGPNAIWAAYVALIIALLLLNYGRSFTRRFADRFRQDTLLIPGLRGLDNQHTLFNYASPALPDHVLVGPTGLYVLLPRTQAGRIRFEGGRWSRGSVAGGLLRGLAEGGLGNPLADMQQAMRLLAAYLQKHASADAISGLEGRPIVVFTNPQARLEVRNSAVPVVQAKELKSVFRRAKPTLAPERVEELKQVLGREIEV